MGEQMSLEKKGRDGKCSIGEDSSTNCKTVVPRDQESLLQD